MIKVFKNFPQTSLQCYVLRTSKVAVGTPTIPSVEILNNAAGRNSVAKYIVK